MPDQLRISAVRVDENNPTVYFVPLDIAVGERDEARAERDRLREALEGIAQALDGFVEGGEPAAEDAADILARARAALKVSP
jgi:hypothetical protein